MILIIYYNCNHNANFIQPEILLFLELSYLNAISAIGFTIISLPVYVTYYFTSRHGREQITDLPAEPVEAASEKRAEVPRSRRQKERSRCVAEQTARMSMLRQLNLVWRERRAVLLRSYFPLAPCLSANVKVLAEARRADLFPRGF